MERPARVLCVMDLALEGRASLSAAPAVLAACGAQAVCLPTALFSAHTAGYGPVQRQDNAAFCAAALDHFEREGVEFDAVLVGYLFGAGQLAVAKRALGMFPAALKLVDPALGDGGRLYSGLGPDEVAGMQALCRLADVITPNVTETALLCGEDPAVPATRGDVLRRMQGFCGPSQSWLVTSLPGADEEPGQATTGGFDAGNAQAGMFTLASRRAPQSYPGTGDLFTAALAGGLLARQTGGLQGAAQTASRFVEAAAWATWQGGGDARAGVWFEPFLHLLSLPNNGEEAHG